MTGKTHLAAGVATSLALCDSYEQGLLVVLGSILSDIDHPNSTIGKYVPFVPKMLPHRGVTHCLLFAVLCYVISPFLAYGVLTHIVLDMMTRQGIKLLWPLDMYIKFPLAKYVKTGGKFETVLFYATTAGILYLLGGKLWPPINDMLSHLEVDKFILF